MAILSLPPDTLGLGLQDPKIAMVDQAARTILEWNSREHDKAWAATHILIASAIGRQATDRIHCYPTARQLQHRPTVSGKTDLMELGWKVVNQQISATYRMADHLRERRIKCILQLTSAASCLQWLTSATGQFRIPGRIFQEWRETAVRNYADMPPELRSFWTTFPWADNSWIVAGDGQALRRNDYKAYTATTMADVHLTYQGEGIFTFAKPVLHHLTLSTAALERMASWIWILIVNTGIPPFETTAGIAAQRVYSINRHPIFTKYEWILNDNNVLTGTAIDQKWKLREAANGVDQITAHVGGWGRPVRFLTASSAPAARQDLDHLQSANFGVVVLAGHPQLQHGPTLVNSASPCTRSLGTADLKRALRPPQDQRQHKLRVGADMICQRLDRTRREHQDVYGALQCNTLDTATGMKEGLSLYQQIFRYRLLLGALNARGRHGELLACPHAYCPHHKIECNIGHIVWDCAGAQAVWTSIWTKWTRTSRSSPTAFHCFRPEHPLAAIALRQALVALDETNESSSKALTLAWSILCTVAAQQLWLIRNAACFHNRVFTPVAMTAQVWKTFRGQLRAGIEHLEREGNASMLVACLGLIDRALDEDAVLARPATTQVRLYYDGGARGNPGPSGAGSIILELGPREQWRIVWWQSTYCGRYQTNNFAEHVGAMVGLEECERRYRANSVCISVIGDSELVTTQLAGHRRVRTKKLKSIYLRSARALAQLPQYELLHTRRAGNKMADFLANRAMDSTRTSQNDTARSESTTTVLGHHLANDIAHSPSRLKTNPTLSTQLRRRFHDEDSHLPQHVPEDTSAAKRVRIQ